MHALLTEYFRDKSNLDLDRTMDYFSRAGTTYLDATLGWAMHSWQEVYDAFAQNMPNWPPVSASYPTRVIGDENSAIVFFTDAAGMFGPKEIRLAGAVDVRDGKIVRWVDYWDGRHFGVESFQKLRMPEAPTDYGEARAGVAASEAAQQTVTNLTSALRAGNPPAAVECFTPDAVYEDLPAHLQVIGQQSIGAFLTKAAKPLPYAGPDVEVRHVLSGGYEWTGPDGFGITALELDDEARISRLTSTWNGALVTPDTLLELAAAAIEY
ncbi:nuclear transport factor 2 family protein [Amycolatopsis samaneae]|uniref:Nuclear transport factor 2 family protein n=1 Tax=Amycolatopsis samaneae TaxID=664691 RepID=A0ABW5GDC2_9PSEU